MTWPGFKWPRIGTGWNSTSLTTLPRSVQSTDLQQVGDRRWRSNSHVWGTSHKASLGARTSCSERIYLRSVKNNANTKESRHGRISCVHSQAPGTILVSLLGGDAVWTSECVLKQMTAPRRVQWQTLQLRYQKLKHYAGASVSALVPAARLQIRAAVDIFQSALCKSQVIEKNLPSGANKLTSALLKNLHQRISVYRSFH